MKHHLNGVICNTIRILQKKIPSIMSANTEMLKSAGKPKTMILP